LIHLSADPAIDLRIDQHKNRFGGAVFSLDGRRHRSLSCLVKGMESREEKKEDRKTRKTLCFRGLDRDTFTLHFNPLTPENGASTNVKTRKILSLSIALAILLLSIAPAVWALEPGNVDYGDKPLFTAPAEFDPELLFEEWPTGPVELISPVIGEEDVVTVEGEDGNEGVLEDGATGLTLATPVSPDQLPFADLSDAEIAKRMKNDPASLGSMSIGFTNSGALFGGIQLQPDPRWSIVNAKETYGTEETVKFIKMAIGKVNEAYPNTPPLHIGDISDHNGGRLNRHASHQAGRDVDLGFYYKGGAGQWYTVGGAGNLDLARNWALVRALLVHADAELILVDRRIQLLLYDYARGIGEDKAWLDSVFQYPNGRGYTIIRHARRHHTHYHVRFYNPRAQEIGRRAYKQLIAQKKIAPPVSYTYHKVRSGQTLGHMARRYGTSVRAIKRANGLRSTTIRAGRTYRIPRKGGVARVPAATNIPARKLPPSVPSVLAHVDWNPGQCEAPKIRRSVVFDKDDGGRKIAYVRLAAASAVVAADVAVAEPAKPKPKRKKTGLRRTYYKVRSGDNLWTIARRHGVAVKDLKRWNGLKSNKLRPGQRLALYVKRR
jgi:LysM repeat protein